MASRCGIPVVSKLLSRLLIMAWFAGSREANAGAPSMPTYIFMNVAKVGTDGESMEVCANFYPNLAKMKGALPPARSLEEATPFHLAYYDNDDICRPLPPSRSLNGDIVHTYLHFGNWSTPSVGTCDEEKMSVNERISKLQEQNASAVLFVTTPDETHAFYYDPRINASLAYIPIYYINRQTEQRLSNFVNRSMASWYTLRFYIPRDPVIDSAMVVIMMISLICIAIGGLWSGHKRYELYTQEANKKLAMAITDTSSIHQPHEQRPEIGNVTVSGEQAKPHDVGADNSGSEAPSAPFTWITLVFFIVLIVGFLMLLYFLFNVFVWLVIVIFVIASSSAMCECLWYFVQKIPYGKCAFRLHPLADLLTCICRCCTWKTFRVSVEYRHAVLYAFSLSVAIVWCVFRHWSYSFVLHDILAMFFSIVTIRNLRMPNLMWVTSLLSALLVYDLFMVFITPYFTPSGCSVMIDVATGGACSKNANLPDATYPPPPPSSAPQKEELPIVIRVPRFNDPRFSCYRTEVDLEYPPVMLGLGDIILPGVLVGFNAAFSIALKTPYRLYYVVAVVGYFLGMIATFAALILSQSAQPALIYLVPFTLIPTHITALIRKEWKRMWKGQFPLPEESCPILTAEASPDRPPTVGQTANVSISASASLSA